MELREAIEEIKKHRAMICSELPEGPLLTALQAVADGTLIPADELPTDDTDELISIADLLEAAEKGIKELEMDLREAENRANKFATKEMHTEKRALKAEAERDQAIRREQALKSSYDGERKALVENIRLRERIKELEGVIRAKDYDYNRAIDERDQALSSVGAVIEKAANLMADWWNHPAGLDGTPAEIVRAINTDATDALNEMLADAWDEGRQSRLVERNPHRKAET